MPQHLPAAILARPGTKRSLTAQEAINLLAFGSESNDDMTGAAQLASKWHGEPQAVMFTLRSLIEHDTEPSSRAISNPMLEEILKWPRALVEETGSTPVELLSKLEAELEQVAPRQETYRAAERYLVRLLADGALTAVATPSEPLQSYHGPDPVPLVPISTAEQIAVAIWNTPGIGIWPDGHVGWRPGAGPPPAPWFGPTFVAIRFKRAEVARFGASSSDARAGTSVAARTRLQNWLIERIRLSPEHSPGREAIKREAEMAGHKLGPRAFDHAWKTAVQIAEVPAWSLPGRKSQRGNRNTD